MNRSQIAREVIRVEMMHVKGASIGHRLREWLVTIGLIAFMAIMMTLRIFVIGFASGPLNGYVPIILVGAMIVFMVAWMTIMRRRHQHGGSGNQGMMPMAAIMSAMHRRGGDQTKPSNGIVYEAPFKKGVSDAANSVSEELTRAGLVVVGKIDMQKEFKERNWGQIGGFTIMDVFSPNEILHMTKTSKAAGTLFPWRIVVRSNDSGTLVSLYAPLGYFEGKHESEEARQKLKLAIDAAIQA